MYLYDYQLAGPLYLPEIWPSIESVVFENKGRTHRDNCAVVCRKTPDSRCDLGVGVNKTGACSMELQFTIAGHEPGFEYDIKRTRRNSLWERRENGVWTRLEFVPSGTPDDHDNDDECRTPTNNRIFVVDRVGFAHTELPAPRTHRFTTADDVYTQPDALEVVFRASFEEWVLAQKIGETAPWKTIGPNPPVSWHCIIWMVRDKTNQWVMDKRRSRIELGALSEDLLKTRP
jgi:hypothetical protein